MKKILSIVPRWIPALFMMLVIFMLSSQPADNMPNFLGWDYFVKKTSHAIGYGLLGLSYLHLLKHNKNQYWLAWLMAIIFSITDEFHQSFVPGRRASFSDVLIFDNLGAIILLGLHSRFWRNEKNRFIP